MATKHSNNFGNQPDLEKSMLRSDLAMQPTFGSVDVPRTGKTAIRQEDAEWNSSKYDMTKITSWSMLVVMTGGCFDNPSILRCMASSMFVSFVVACYTYHRKQALFIKTEKVQELGTFLNVFVGMLLAFFLSSSMSRWHACVNGYIDLLEAVRCMQMHMISLGVDRERINWLNRYGLLSAWLAHLSMDSEFRNSRLSDAARKAELWTLLEKHRPHLVVPKEKALLYNYNDCFALLWTWVASLVGRMAADGEIPPMGTPTYGRLINMVEWAYSSIQALQMINRVKAPFIYVHTLAILVHFNTFLNSLSFGTILGMTMQVAVGKDLGMFQQFLPNLLGDLFMQLCISMVAPWLYLALLELCVCISSPFTFVDTKIPAFELVLKLEEDLTNTSVMSESTRWEKPHFKK